MDNIKTTTQYINEVYNYNELMNIIISGCKFKYISYDHKKALEEYKNSEEYVHISNLIPDPDYSSMPDKLKLKYGIYKIGKLREIRFAPNGKAYKFRIENKMDSSKFY